MAARFPFPWPWTERPARAAAAAAILVAGITVLVAVGMRQAGHYSWINPLLHWLHLREAHDSWMPMRAALDHLAAGGRPAGLYAHVFFDLGIKFQYPPSSLLAMDGLDRLAGSPVGLRTLARINAAMVVLNVLACAALGAMLGRRGGLGRGTSLMLAALGATLVLCSFPVLRAASLGQVQVWINALFALACLGWAGGRPLAAGALLGLVVLLKPQFALFGAWGLWRRQWRFLAGFCGVLAAGLALSLHRFGWDMHVAYLRVLRSLARTGEAFHANQSFNGVLNRLLQTGPSLEWNANGFPAYHPLVHHGTTVASVMLLGACAAWLHTAERLPARPPLLELQAAALAFTLASPIAWEHHYGIVPPVILAAFVAMQAMRARQLAVPLAAAWFLLATPVSPLFERWAGGPGGLLLSSQLAGALLLLAVTLVLVRRSHQGRSTNGSTTGVRIGAADPAAIPR